MPVILRHYQEQRISEEELLKAIAAISVLYGVKEPPDDLTFGFLKDYILNDAPKMSYNELIQAFKMNAADELESEKVVCYGMITFEFFVAVVKNYCHERSKAITEQWKKPNPNLKQIEAPQPIKEGQAVKALEEFIEKHGTMPAAFPFGLVWDELLAAGKVTEEALENAQKSIRLHYLTIGDPRHRQKEIVRQEAVKSIIRKIYEK